MAITNEQLNAIRKRAEAATPVPWRWEVDLDETEMDSLVTANDEGVMHFGDCEQFYPTEGSPPNAFDAEFIANARQDVPALLAEVERLRREREVLTNSYVKLLVHDIELMDAYIPGWRAYAVKELTALKELIANDSEKV